MASFNSFPIPTVLEQLKNADVDDAIHDIAERKHVFEGPMRLSPGRLYFINARCVVSENGNAGIFTDENEIFASIGVVTSSPFVVVSGFIFFVDETSCIFSFWGRGSGGRTYYTGGSNSMGWKEVSSRTVVFNHPTSSEEDFLIIEV